MGKSDISGLHFPLSWEMGKGWSDFALVCPVPGVVGPRGHRDLGFMGEVWLTIASRSSATLSQARTAGVIHVVPGGGERTGTLEAGTSSP